VPLSRVSQDPANGRRGELARSPAPTYDVRPRGNPTGMAKKPNADETRAAVRDAHGRGESPSATGATTGASKQRDHVRTKEDRHQHSSARGKSKS
jgi:hypothetical protein